MLTKGERLTEDMCYNAWLNILRNPLSCAKELDILESLIKEHFNPNPYKYEDLKVGMWVWENKLKMCVKIRGIIELEDENKKCIDYGFGYIEYKDGDFYPVTKYLQYQNKGETDNE